MNKHMCGSIHDSLYRQCRGTQCTVNMNTSQNSRCQVDTSCLHHSRSPESLNVSCLIFDRLTDREPTLYMCTWTRNLPKLASLYKSGPPGTQPHKKFVTRVISHRYNRPVITSSIYIACTSDAQTQCEDAKLISQPFP